LPETPGALSDCGAENRIFVERIGAQKSAANAYFIRLPNQCLEGKLCRLFTGAAALSIKRHRIAHGQISMWGEFKVPETQGSFQIEATMLYRWGAPWYSMVTLRTDPVGTDAAAINAAEEEFAALHNRVSAFIDEMPAPPSRDIPQGQ
jgi:hypothetical protein